MKSKLVLLLMFVIGILLLLPVIAQAQEVPIDVSPSGNVVQGTSVLITTSPNAVCTIDFSDGTPSATDTADDEGRILLFVNNPPNTVLTIFCQVGNVTSDTVPITVITGTPTPTFTPGGPTPTPTPQVSDFVDSNLNITICAPDLNAEARMDSQADAPINRYLVPNVAETTRLQRQYNTGVIWYQLSDGMWVVASDVRTSNCTIGATVPNTDLDLGDILGDCPELIQVVIDTLPPDVIVNNSDGEPACTIYQNLVFSWGNAPASVDPLSSDAGLTLFDADECTGAEAMVIPGFVDVLDNLGREVREQVRAVLDRNDPCEFANNLIQSNWIRFDLLDGDDGIDSQTALGLIIDSCEPFLDPTVADDTNDRFIEMFGGDDYRTYFTSEVNDVCALVETLIFVGDFSAEQEMLFDIFTDVCEWDADHAFEIVTYATTIGGNASIKDIIEDANTENFCGTIESNLTLYVFDPNDLSADEAIVIQQIAGALDECATDDTELLIMVMSAWNQWDDLEHLQKVALLTAENPCEAIVTWLTTGVAPTFPVGEPEPPLPPPMSSGDVEDRIGDIPDEDIPAPDGEDGGLTTRDRIIRDVDATAIFIGNAGGSQRLYIISAGESQEVQVAQGRNISYPVLNATGEWAAYLDLEAGEVRRIWLAIGSDEPIITSEMLTNADCDLALSDYPIAWSPDDSRLLVTLRNSDGVLGIYSYHFYDNALDCDPLLLNAHSPAFAQRGRAFLFVDTTTNSSDIGYYNLHSGYSGRYALANVISASSDVGGLNIPVTECFAPAYHLGTDAEETLVFVFACRNREEVLYFQREFIGGRTEIRQLDLRLDEFEAQGLVISNIQNVVPGPAPDYVAFDDGVRVYFVRMWDNNDADFLENNPETGVLIQLPNYDVSLLRWVPAH